MLPKNAEMKSQQEINDFDLAMVNVWDVMGSVYEEKWYSKKGELGDEDCQIDRWSEYLSELTPEQIGSGVKEVTLIRKLEWPPNVQDFKAICFEISHHGLPSLRDAYKRACDNCHRFVRGRWDIEWWKHPIEEAAARQTGISVLRKMPVKNSWPAFEVAYDQLRQRLARGEDLSAPVMKALEQLPPEPMEKSETKKRFAALRKSLKE